MKLPFKIVLSIIGGVIVIVAVTTAAYFYMQYQKAQQLLKNPTLAAQQQTIALLAQVGKLIELPADEQPVIYTVSDSSKLKDQPFFAHATNGDKVIIYTKARKAILYDPAANIIVDVAPVNLGQTQPAVSSVSPTVTAKPTKILRTTK